MADPIRRIQGLVNHLVPGFETSSLSSLDMATTAAPGANSTTLHETVSHQHSAFMKMKQHESKAPADLMSSDFKIDDIKIYEIPNVTKFVKDKEVKVYPNKFSRTEFGHMDGKHYRQIIKGEEIVVTDNVRTAKLGTSATAFLRAGPRAEICWAPGEVKAAIVTCGGLCPGLNDVIAELFNCLYYNYGVDTIYGIRNGFTGFWDERLRPWQVLTPEKVKDIHKEGGTVLSSTRGGFDLKKICDSLEVHGVNQLFIIGGDGTHRGARAVSEECFRRGLKVCVAGIPKTIDNDIGVIDRSFGFNTAVNKAREAIASAYVEARCTPGGIGIVKLMGRHAGFIAAHATLASRDVNLCLIPEVKFPMEGDHGVLYHIERVVKKQGYAVVVLAEGAGEHLLPTEGTDKSGNKAVPEIGPFIMKALKQHFKKLNIEIALKYHDPSYMIRSVPPTASDAIYCMTIASNAVHGAMAGFTSFSSAVVNNRSVMIPITVVDATSPSSLNPKGRTWERVLSITHQPVW